MKGVGRHHGEREKLPARQELKQLGGDLKFWDYFKSRCRTCPGIGFKYSRKGDFAKIRQHAHSLQCSIGKLGLSTDEPLMLMLLNLQWLFAEGNRFTLNLKRGGRNHILNPEVLSLDPSELFWEHLFGEANLGYAESAGVGSGRFPKDLLLYYFVPALAVYTKYLCGEPRWNLISRLLSEELGLTCTDSGLKRWWAEGVATLTRKSFAKLDPARKELLSAVYMYPWWQRCSRLNLLDKSRELMGVRDIKGNNRLSPEEKRYYGVLSKLCHFYESEAMPSRFSLPNKVLSGNLAE